MSALARGLVDIKRPRPMNRAAEHDRQDHRLRVRPLFQGSGRLHELAQGEHVICETVNHSVFYPFPITFCSYLA